MTGGDLALVLSGEECLLGESEVAVRGTPGIGAPLGKHSNCEPNSGTRNHVRNHIISETKSFRKSENLAGKIV